MVVNADAWSREAVARLSDATWRRLQRERRWLRLGTWAWCLLLAALSVWVYCEANLYREKTEATVAGIQAQAAEIRLAVEYRRCESFPSACKLRQSVFFQRQPTKRR